MKFNHLIVSTFVFLCAVSSIASRAQDCGSAFDVKVGPWDYTDPFNHSKESTTSARFDSKIDIVESVHFTPDVQQLIRGATGKEVLPDISYTLLKIPNHHKALYTLIKYDQQVKGVMPQKGFKNTQSVSCYIKRALEFKPSDATIHYLYGIYFHFNKKYKHALKQFMIADKKLDSPELDYNIGLAFFAEENYEKAQEYAIKAYAGKFQLNGLRNKLKTKGIILD